MTTLTNGGHGSFTFSTVGGTLTNSGTYGSTTASGSYAVYLLGLNEVMINSGTIVPNPLGIAMQASDQTVSNAAGGIILGTGTFGAIQAYVGSGTITGETVVNAGTISSPGASFGAIVFKNGKYGGTVSGDVVTNTATGIIGASIYFQGNTNHLANAGVVVNSGTILGGGPNNRSAIALYGNGGTVTNLAGTIAANGAGSGIAFQRGSGTVTNAGTINAASATGTAVSFAAVAGNRFIDDYTGVVLGKVNGGSAATLELAAATGAGTLTSFSSKYTNFSQVTIDSGAYWNVDSTDVFGAGVTLTNAGTLTTNGAVTVSGLLVNNRTVLLNSGSLQISALSGAGEIIFKGNSGILAFGTAAATVDTIYAMRQGETIEILGKTITSANLHAGNTLALGFSGGAVNVQLFLGDNFTGKFFHSAVTGTNSFITVDTSPCYLAGTRIRTDRGAMLVEDLQIGDCVITLDGTAKPIEWIGRRAFSSAFAAGNRDVIPILFKQGSLGRNVPERDLYVSPLHAMFFGDVLVQAEHLVNGTSVVRCPEIDPIRYFHIELKHHDVIFAEGAPAETFVDCDSRGMFHNASEFSDLYPGVKPQAWKFCFPRIESGPVLENIRREIDLRAGLTDASPGPLEGNLDGMNGAAITGWAFDPAHPDTPVVLEILDGDGLIARVTANRFRSDLEAAGIGDGRHGFELKLSRPLSSHTRHEIRARRLADGRELGGSPLAIEPFDRASLVSDARDSIDLAVETARETGGLDGVLQALLQGIDQVRRLRLTQYTQPLRKRALMVDTMLPRGDCGADISALLAQGWQVEFVASAELAGGDEAVAALQALGVVCHRAPLVASVEEVLRRKRDMFDLVCLGPDAEAYTALARTWQPRARLAFADGVDPHGAARAA